jgi:hypothetical protein
MSKEAMKQALEALEYIDNNYMSLPKVGNEAIKALEEALAKQEQGEPVGFIGDRYNGKMSGSAYPEPMAIWINHLPPIGSVLYTTPQQRKPLWIDPNDKTQTQFLPHIGEPILFCHKGKTYYGRHTGGSFRTGQGITAIDFITWSCHWMYLPAAHGIKE